MNIVIIGSGGRENAIANALMRSEHKPTVYYYGSYINPGMVKAGVLPLLGKLTQQPKIIEQVKSVNANFVIVGPEAPLQTGLADLLWDNGIPCIGPIKKYAKLETSKVFCRMFMTRNRMSDYCPKYKILRELNRTVIKDAIKELDNNFVLKPDGLCGGKGVKLSGDHIKTDEEAVEMCYQEIVDNKVVLLEEKLEGEEFSLMSFVDGTNLAHMPPVQDYKRLNENDTGPNTGGMGSITDNNGSLPFLTVNNIREAQSVNELIVKHIFREQFLRNDKCKGYKGILYGSFMKTKTGLKVIEYNVRFGDPECINVLGLLKTDLVSVCQDMINGTLTSSVEFEKKASVCRYVVPKGYPLDPKRGYEVFTDDIVHQDNLYYANVEIRNDFHYYQLGSRILAYLAIGKDLDEANDIIDKDLKNVMGLVQYRSDIGKKFMNSYKKSGVNIDNSNLIVSNMGENVISTFNSNVMSKFGDFYGRYRINESESLVCSTDGVGTKSVLLKRLMGKKGLEVCGHDLVSHCVNDILVSGADPMLFLDYFASSKLDKEEIGYFIKGISDMCKEVGCVLLGGETAEMPTVYNENREDMVGTIVGRLADNRYINTDNIVEGDILYNLESTGLHTNGYSLVNKLVKGDEEEEILQLLCNSHKCYMSDVKKIRDRIDVHGLCHITGGGIKENMPRILPSNLTAVFEKIKFPKIFDWIKREGKVSEDEMLRVFNCGIGMIVIGDSESEGAMNDLGYKRIGYIKKKS